MEKIDISDIQKIYNNFVDSESKKIFESDLTIEEYYETEK